MWKNVGFVALSMLLTCCHQDFDNSENIHFYSSHENSPHPSDEPFLKFDAIQKLHAKCISTKGYWNLGLISCICPPGELFNPNRGCQSIQMSHPARACSEKFSFLSFDSLQQCINYFIDMPSFQVRMNLSGFSHQEVSELTHQLDRDFTSVLKGEAFFDGHREEDVVLKVKKTDKVAFNSTFMPWVDTSYMSAYTTFVTSIRSPGSMHFNAREFAHACMSAIRPYGYSYMIDTKGDDKNHEDMCWASSEMLSSIINIPNMGSTLPVSTHFNEEGEGCSNDCAFIAGSNKNGYPVRYRVLMKRYVPIIRSICVGGPQRMHLCIFISALGKVESAVFSSYQLAHPQDDFLLKHVRHIFDDRWMILNTITSPLGDRKTFMEALKEVVDPGHKALPTDGQRFPIQAPVQAVMIDSGIDIRVPGLLSRLQMNTHAASHVLKAGQFIDNLFYYPRNTINHTLDVVDGEHGAQVASIIVEDLPNAQLDFISGYQVSGYEDNLILKDRWIYQIKKSRARVVNISMVFGRSITSCEAFFGSIFQALPDVLFIAGMGNQGAKNPTGTCPAGIAYAYHNVLTVAGTREDGTLHELSNYGCTVAMVAAPYGVYSIRGGHSLTPLDPTIVKRWGTSMSTALVTNTALRLLARQPYLKPEHIIGKLMRSCKKSRLDVECGGAINLDALQ